MPWERLALGDQRWEIQPRSIAGASKVFPPLVVTRRLVSRLERRADLAAGEVMAKAEANGKLDVEQIRADRAAGLTLAEIASKHGCHKSKIYRHLNGTGTKKRVAQPSKVTSDGNGHADSAELRALEAIIAARWNHLVLAEKLRLLLPTPTG